MIKLLEAEELMFHSRQNSLMIGNFRISRGRGIYPW